MKTVNEKIDIKKIYEEVDILSDYILEQYSPELKEIRKIGDLTLKVISRIEELLDEIIVMWAEKHDEKIKFSERLNELKKYGPLLSRLFLSEKVKVLKDYKLLNKNDSIVKDVQWLNDRRNEFAHYHVYRHKINNDFKNLSSIRKYLLKLKSIIFEVKILRDGVNSALRR